MQLSYRGASYYNPTRFIEVMETPFVAYHRGSPYRVMCAAPAPRKPQNLIYRGVNHATAL